MKNILFILVLGFFFINIAYASAPVITPYTPINGSLFLSSANIDPFVFKVVDDLDVSIPCTLTIYWFQFFPLDVYSANVNNNTITTWDLAVSYIEGYYSWDIYCEDSSFEDSHTDYIEFTVIDQPVSEPCPECCTEINQTNVYGDFTTPYVNFSWLLGLTLILISIYGIVWYALAVFH